MCERQRCFSLHLVQIVRKLCTFPLAMRQKIFWRHLGGSGKGKVRIHQSEQEERNCSSLGFHRPEFNQVLGKESRSVICVLLGKKGSVGKPCV